MVLVLLAACAHHIPEPVVPLAALPTAPAAATALARDPSAPSSAGNPAATSALRLCRAEFASGKLPGGLVVARGRVRGTLASTQSGAVLVHPNGSWLVDGGMAAEVDTHLADLRGLLGALVRASAKDWVRKASPAQALGALGVDPTNLTGSIATHGHYDHLGGLLDLPGIPVWVPEGELADARISLAGGKSSVLPAEATELLERGRAIPFEGPSVGPWPASWDLLGDGSAMVVPMPGHTPGSVGVLVHAGGRRALFVGDTVWVREGYEARAPKSAIAAGFDTDRTGTDHQIQLLWQLHRADPDLVIVPAHDQRQWDALFGDAACLG
jgi:glyoxylase-like metal-dependent hydrolase (beta-lactamase superfamily II)